MTPNREFHVLGIESSCDDTGVALVDQNGQILSNCIHSQLKQHLFNGGIIPVVAKEYHMSNIDRVAKKAFEQSGLKSVDKDIDAIAVSTRPGLNFSLQVGLNYARTLAKKYSKPLIPIHHMQAHALMPLLQNGSVRFPFLALLISGGHCILSIAKRYNNFHILGSTMDEAPGDLLDKFARRFKLRNLGPPFDNISGGAAVELLSNMDGADKFRYFNSEKSVPMLKINSCDFSFSGYRGCFDTVAPVIDKLWFGDREELLSELGHISASLQRLILIQFVKKLYRAIMFYRMHWRFKNEDAFASNTITKHLGFDLQQIDDDTSAIDVVVSGGVAANSYFIDGIKMACMEDIDSNIKVYSPTKHLCSDNGLMVAWNGMLRYQDFMRKRNSYDNGYIIDTSVVCDKKQMDSVNVQARCAMGLDISDQVRQTKFKLYRLTQPEFKMKKSY